MPILNKTSSEEISNFHKMFIFKWKINEILLICRHLQVICIHRAHFYVINYLITFNNQLLVESQRNHFFFFLFNNNRFSFPRAQHEHKPPQCKWFYFFCVTFDTIKKDTSLPTFLQLKTTLLPFNFHICVFSCSSTLYAFLQAILQSNLCWQFAKYLYENYSIDIFLRRQEIINKQRK